MRKIVHVFSGGLDSTVLLYDLLADGVEVQCVNFHYGSKHNDQECRRAEVITKELEVPMIFMPINVMGQFRSALLTNGEPIPNGHYQDDVMRKTVVPFRNGIMLSIACGLAESLGFDVVSYGAHSGDHAIYPDCRPSFLKAMSSAMRMGTYNGVELTAPYLFNTKRDIVKRGSELKVPFHNTWTCYKGLEYHCGVCGACVERKEAFAIAGVPDETIYKETN